MHRWLRVLICLLLVSCILVNLSPLKADATAAGLGAVITSAASVAVPAPLIVGASLIALGVMADSVNSLVFENVVDTAVDTLSSAGQYVVDGCVELLRTVDETGNAAYYVAGEFLEALRSGLFSEGVISAPDEPLTSFTYTKFNGTSVDATASPGCFWGSGLVGKYVIDLFWYSEPFSLVRGDFSTTVVSTYNGVYRTWGSAQHRYYTETLNITLGDYSSVSVSSDVEAAQYLIDNVIGSVTSVSTPYDLSLGQISTVPIDGTSARSWASDEVADRNGLYVKYNNDPEPPDDNNGKWFWRLALPLTAASLLAMSQADEWTGETPPEFSEYSTSQEFEILDQPEIDGYQGVEIAVPGTGGGTAGDGDGQESTDPTTDGEAGTGGGPAPDTGGSTDPDSGSESDPDTDPDTDPDADPDATTPVVPDPDPDTGQDPSTELNSDLNHFTLDLSKYFPFCIPFDLYDFFTCLNAAPEAPVIYWEIPLPGGSTYPMEIDLSPFNSVAQLLRRLQLLLFCTGLAFKTRDLIKG